MRMCGIITDLEDTASKATLVGFGLGARPEGLGEGTDEGPKESRAGCKLESKRMFGSGSELSGNLINLVEGREGDMEFRCNIIIQVEAGSHEISSGILEELNMWGRGRHIGHAFVEGNVPRRQNCIGG